MGERAADRLRNGMGSWTFVLVSLMFLAVWMVLNGTEGFDPYPFILLNLVLRCESARLGPAQARPQWRSGSIPRFGRG